MRCAAAPVTSGSLPRSKRLDASEDSLWRRAVRAMETGSKWAASMTISVVVEPVSSISVCCPPITPASPIGPDSSVITRSAASRVRTTPSRVASFSPGSARRTPIGPLTRLRS